MGGKEERDLHVLDPHARENIRPFVFQTLLATEVVVLSMLFLNFFLTEVMVAAIGSTAFVIFTLPRSHASSFRRVVLSHAICGAMGGLAAQVFLLGLPPLFESALRGGLAVGISIFLMTVTDTEHPPAAGTALGFALEGFNLSAYIYVVAMSLILMGFKRVLKPYLRNLI